MHHLQTYLAKASAVKASAWERRLTLASRSMSHCCCSPISWPCAVSACHQSGSLLHPCYHQNNPSWTGGLRLKKSSQESFQWKMDNNPKHQARLKSKKGYRSGNQQTEHTVQQTGHKTKKSGIWRNIACTVLNTLIKIRRTNKQNILLHRVHEGESFF